MWLKIFTSSLAVSDRSILTVSELNKNQPAVVDNFIKIQKYNLQKETTNIHYNTKHKDTKHTQNSSHKKLKNIWKLIPVKRKTLQYKAMGVGNDLLLGRLSSATHIGGFLLNDAKHACHSGFEWVECGCDALCWVGRRGASVRLILQRCEFLYNNLQGFLYISVVYNLYIIINWYTYMWYIQITSYANRHTVNTVEFLNFRA